MCRSLLQQEQMEKGRDGPVRQRGRKDGRVIHSWQPPLPREGAALESWAGGEGQRGGLERRLPPPAPPPPHLQHHPSQPGSSAWSLIQAFDRFRAWAERLALLSCRGWPRCKISPSREMVKADFSLPSPAQSPH